jgi:hypothetical protein
MSCADRILSLQMQRMPRYDVLTQSLCALSVSAVNVALVSVALVALDAPDLRDLAELVYPGGSG